MSIRAVAICLIEKGDEIFVAEGRDEVKNETYYRPLGGGIEFGERACETVVREFREEMNADIEVIENLHTFENIFTLNGHPGHQLVMLLSARFKDASLYESDNIVCDEEGTAFTAKWIDKHAFFRGEKILYPQGLATYLERRVVR